MAQNGNIRVCSLCEGWQILSEEIAFGSGINFIFISVAGRTSQFFFQSDGLQSFSNPVTALEMQEKKKKTEVRKAANLFMASLYCSLVAADRVSQLMCLNFMDHKLPANLGGGGWLG